MARTESGIAQPDPTRYTLDGDAAVEARIARDQLVIAQAVQSVVAPPIFRGLVLMGGYGRGEGGYVLRDSGPEPYNDYDYFVVVRDLDRAGRRSLEAALAEQAHALGQTVGVEVDFALLLEERLLTAEYSLMNAEMLWGHRVVAGDPEVLAAMPAMPFATLPPGEITRLLMNRGALLLMNQQRLSEDRPLAGEAQEVFFKYLFKAVLACGDARLAGNRCYHPSYVVKRERLHGLEWPGKGELLELYQHAWEAKLRPNYGRYAGEDAGAWQRRVAPLWLATLGWFEEGRLGRSIGDWEGYCSAAVPKGQGGNAWGGLRNAAITLRDFGPVELLRRPRWSLRYPRERLISALPLLLSAPRSVSSKALRPLALPEGASCSDAAEGFLRLWRRYA